jgi:sulfite exporter TauE/SafE
MSLLLLSVLIASLLGSLHCVGMCGGFVAFYAGGDASQKGQAWKGHTAYNGGRLVGYVLLGVLVGSAGAALNLVGNIAGFQRSAAVIAGVMMVVWGIASLVWQRRTLGWQPKLPVRWQQWLTKIHRSFMQRPPTSRALMLGLMSGLLPCGWLYAFVLTAAATGSPFWGGMVMASFWMGTVPALLGLGVGIRWLGQRLRAYLPTLSAVSVLLIGLVTLWSRATVPVVMPAKAAIQKAKQRTPQEQLKAIKMRRKKGHCACHKKKKRPAPRTRTQRPAVR